MTASPYLARLLCAAVFLGSCLAHAAVGLTELPGRNGDGPVTVFYPSSSQEQALRRGPFTLSLAWQGAPLAGNRRLIVISHGSGASPWVQANLARALVDAGFVVALPEHRGDNDHDSTLVGPESWKLRPVEVAHAIDVVGQDPRFAPLLALDRVGMYGMSAGGHTALVLAGGSWSPVRMKQHCEAHLDDDFQACVGMSTSLTGGMFDGVKKTIALSLIRGHFGDSTVYAYRDPRIAAVVAGVPLAADFDLSTLAAPRVPLALVTARLDRWLVPRFHGDAVLAACSGCEHLADIPNAGHGALLAPLPPGLDGLAGKLLNDPPGFDRAGLAAIDRKIAVYFQRQLLP